MKKVKLFSLATAAILLVFTVVWAGTQTYNAPSTLSVILGANALSGPTACIGPKLNGPPTSQLISVRVTGEFASSCIMQSRALYLVKSLPNNNNNNTYIASASIPNGTFDVTMNVPSGHAADENYCIFGNVVRLNTPSNVGFLCSYTIKNLSALFTWQP